VNKFRTFNPDLIVEVTGVCDRACAGCYAPNLISQFTPEELFLTKPEMFLTTKQLTTTLTELTSKPESIALRGGEPSRHPFLTDLLDVAHKYSRNVFVETHGRWILNKTESAHIIQTCAKLGTVLKISFDRMHGLSADELLAITNRLTQGSVDWVIAITEINENEFTMTRNLCDWIPTEKIIYQKKASSLHDLIEPRIGVIKLNGNLSRTLTTKKDFVLKPIFAGLAT